MAGNIQSQSSPAIAPIVDRILESGHLNRWEYLQLVSTILSDYKVTDQQRSQINQVFDELRVGHLKLIN